MKMNCHELELILSARLDGEATASQWRLAEEHMITCVRCTKIWQDFQGGADLLKHRLPSLEPPATLWYGIAARLEHAGRPARLAPFGAWWRRFLELYAPQTPRALYLVRAGFAVLALAALGLPFVLNLSQEQMIATNTPATRDTTFAATAPPRSPSAQAAQNQFVSAGLEQQMVNYLEDTRLLLLEVKNGTSEDQTLDLSDLRRASQRLLEQTVTLKADLKQEDVALLKNFMEQLEPVLLDLANLADAPEREEVELLRAAIRQKDLLIKIEIVDLKALERQRLPQRESPPERRPLDKTVI
ncbi:MAG: anti-sigma factor family protein [bacterium]